MRQGGFDVFDFDCGEWQFLTHLDIAVMPIALDRGRHDFSNIPVSAFLTPQMASQQQVGPGDDVFMTGLFVDHGDRAGTPAFRFGNISMDPAPIRQSNGQEADSFCVDMHSRSGFSGSPVFTYRVPGNDIESAESGMQILGTNFAVLLGIHWGQFPERWEVKAGGVLKEAAEENEPLLTDGNYIDGLSGMTCVLPAWSILEVLNMPKLKQSRYEQDRILAAQLGVSIPPAGDQQPG